MTPTHFFHVLLDPFVYDHLQTTWWFTTSTLHLWTNCDELFQFWGVCQGSWHATVNHFYRLFYGIKNIFLNPSSAFLVWTTQSHMWFLSDHFSCCRDPYPAHYREEILPEVKVGCSHSGSVNPAAASALRNCGQRVWGMDYTYSATPQQSRNSCNWCTHFPHFL